jgi:ribosomal protein S18 acetylase RimI-like enzyme
MKIYDPKPGPLENDEYVVIKIGLNSYNEKFTGTLLRENVSSVLKDDAGNTLGGTISEINWGWLYIKALWVDESIRNEGWGSKLLYDLEKYSLSKGIANIRLETTTFQALGFYQKSGYIVFAELDDMPPGETSYFLKKNI